MSQNNPPPSNSPGSRAPYPPRMAGAVSRPIKQVQPTVSYVLLAITIFVFLLQLISRWAYNGTDAVALLGMKVNLLIEHGQVWRLVTPMFLHSSILPTGLMHIGFNMYALYIFGPGLERMYGHSRFLALYFLAGFAGNVLSFLLSPANSLGASTAVFGLIAAEAVFLYQNRGMIQNSQRMLTNLITIAVINLAIGFAPGMNIDNLGHLGGLLGGAMFAWFGGPLLAVQGYPQPVLVDERTPRQSLMAGLGVFVVFSLLALMEIFLVK
jgi:rhomboid protease GluP